MHRVQSVPLSSSTHPARHGRHFLHKLSSGQPVRVATIGASLTFGHGVHRKNDTWPEQFRHAVREIWGASATEANPHPRLSVRAIRRPCTPFCRSASHPRDTAMPWPPQLRWGATPPQAPHLGFSSPNMGLRAGASAENVVVHAFHSLIWVCAQVRLQRMSWCITAHCPARAQASARSASRRWCRSERT